LEGRLNRPIATIGATTPVSELANLRANATASSHFTIFIEVRRSTAATSVDKILGKTCVPYPETMTFLG
jgi:hypothetical protein